MPKQSPEAEANLSTDAVQDSIEEPAAIETKPPASTSQSSSPVTVRILADTAVAGVALKPNDIAIVSADLAPGLINSGIADDTAEAVAYAISENAETIDTTAQK